MAAQVTHRARYSLLRVELPGHDPVNAGVLLEDPETNHLHVRLRRDWEQIAPEEADVLAALEDDLLQKASEMGAGDLLNLFEATLSHTLQISDRRDVIVEDFERGLNRLYRQNVPSTVERYTTHLPRYSLAVAAGPFLENRAVEAEGWEEVPAGMRLSQDMFVARIQGRSMEPLIPDGSLCVFRSTVTGSRQGRLVLVESLGGGANDRYTVKRYKSEKLQNPDGTWRQERIRLESLNPEFPSWDLDPEEERYRIVGEFVRVLD
jgi:phage repressor protein C with HTH and peptisase S24 domain